MITVVVPIYNLSELLPRCMTTLLSQSGSYEIILIDDGSTDKSPAMCDCYATEFQDRVRVIHKENGGLSSARNAGIEAARGKYIIFPDPDDWVEANYISRLAELQEKYQPDLLCVGHYVDYDDYSEAANDGQSLRQMDALQAQRALLVPPCMSGFAWNKLYHLDIIREKCLRFLDDVGTTEDLDFAFRYLQFCEKVVFSPEDRLYHYYQRPGAATHSGFSRKKMDAIHTYEKMIAATKDKDIIQAAQEEICNTAINLLWIYQNSKSDNRQAKEKIQSYIKTNLKQYCSSKQFGAGRKIQAILACYMPRVYACLKNKVTKGM